MDIISHAQASNLFWLGRYTQRVYKILHFLRKFRDELIDVDEYAYRVFLEKLGVTDRYCGRADFLRRYLFDKSDPYSLVSTLTCAHSDAIELRNLIRSETLSYVEMCAACMEECAASFQDINSLQPVSDRLMSFWGAVDERIFPADVRNLIKIGWYIESFDLHVRFDYPYERILYLLDRMARHLELETNFVDKEDWRALKSELRSPHYDKDRILDMIAALCKRL